MKKAQTAKTGWEYRSLNRTPSEQYLAIYLYRSSLESATFNRMKIR